MNFVEIQVDSVCPNCHQLSVASRIHPKPQRALIVLLYSPTAIAVSRLCWKIAGVCSLNLGVEVLHHHLVSMYEMKQHLKDLTFATYIIKQQETNLENDAFSNCKTVELMITVLFVNWRIHLNKKRPQNDSCTFILNKKWFNFCRSSHTLYLIARFAVWCTYHFTHFPV